jgi:amino acid adenylation domain-containing protein
MDRGEQTVDITSNCVHELFERQARINPTALAVSEGNRYLSYGELDGRSNELAQHLLSAGVGPEVVVGLCSPNSIAMIVSALAILKAGGAYLPLDPSHPTQRLSSILNEAGVPVLITAACMAQSLSGDMRTVTINELGMAATDKRPSGNLDRSMRVTPKNLAYVIYTSGSTGEPKGVEVTHENLLNLVSWHQEAFSVGSEDRASQLAGVGFDAAVWEIWPYLTAGASLHIADAATRTEPEKLRDWLISQQITTSFVPTVMAERIMALEWPSNASLRCMLTGADTLHHYPSAKLPFILVNNYGPTECTVVATSGVINPNECTEQRPPIGKPIANTQVHIVDEHMRPVPTGTPGEIYIGGAGVARGYRNRSTLTHQKFVRDPFSNTPGARLYKTGDLGRYLPAGEIEFLGRIDDQIKIRGYRIEPNEIVSTFNKFDGIRESAVVAQESCSGDSRLIAYVVLSPDSKTTSTQLRTFLSTRLPDYMIPANFVRLDSLPVNSNGKVDRASLPAPSASNSLHDDDLALPASSVEKAVAEILSHLLKVDQIGANANFFMIGGHSLLGTQLIARAQDTFGVGLTLRNLFDNPTVAGIAKEIERLIHANIDSMTEEELRYALDENNAWVA